MRLYLEADSQMEIGYTPDWIKICWSSSRYEYELILDIQGEIDYSHKTLSCRCKGELVPWVLRKRNDDIGYDEEIDLFDESKQDYVRKSFFPKRIAELFEKATSFEVGVYPDSNDDLDIAEKDKLSNGKGLFEYMDMSKEFEFTTELNIY